jgi:hypothetical protein
MGVRKAGQLIILFTALGLGISFGTIDNAMGEPDCDPLNPYRSINGTCNNIDNRPYGSAGTELIRQGDAHYNNTDGSTPIDTRPSPREISNVLANQTQSVLNKDHATDFIWQWGQFLDHDIDLTPSFEPHQYFNITIPSGDPFFDPFDFGNQTIPLARSDYSGGSSGADPRQQINHITAFIDASNVYGSDIATANSLRGENGTLINSTGNLLPIDNFSGFFMAGDVRANEQIGLTAMHTLFMREHNRLAEEIAEKHPDFNSTEIYETARKVVGAEMQVITYQEFLPKLLGPDSIPHYAGYNSTIDPGIRNEFSTASYRYGHSQLSSNLLIVNESGNTDVPLREAFFNNTKFRESGLEGILRGLAAQKAQEIDTLVVDDVRNFLFGPPGSGGFDLASLNIQRGRDHGLPDYNSARVAYGLEPVTSFDQISSKPETQQKLRDLYGDVNNIDLWVGGLAEDHVPNAMVGETIQAVLTDQFTKLRDGDRFWYQNDQFFLENKEHMKQVEKTTLADVIKRNTSIEDIQHNVFHYKKSK